MHPKNSGRRKDEGALAALVSVALGTSAAAAVTIQSWVANATPAPAPAPISGMAGEIGNTLPAPRFSVAPTDLTSFSQFGAPLRLNVTAPGVGVNGGGSSSQVDPNNP